MKEFKDLPKEKQEELLEVKECCKISENEFEKRFDALSFDDKKYLTISIIDSDFIYDDGDKELSDDVIELNEKVVGFLKKQKYHDVMVSCLNDLHCDSKKQILMIKKV
jgi:hypothetical protein